MSTGVYSGVGAMATAQARMDRLANNLANVQTTAYKRQTSFVHALGRSGEFRVGHQVDFSQGELERDGNPLHLALDGEGFFAVEGPNGEVYTRNGAFLLDDSGALLTQSGLPVAWEELRGAIDPTGEELRVGSDGTVSQGGRTVGRLRVVNFADLQRLQQDSTGYFRAPLDLAESTHTAAVHQGALEGSNVAPIQEMIAMITVQRSFGGASNVLGMIADTYRRLSRI